MKSGPLKLSEYQQQCLVVEYLDVLITQGKLELYTAVNPRPNMEHVGQRMKAKKAGLNSGFPDLIILTKKEAFCIEMKIRPNIVSFEQQKWISRLNNIGINTYVAYSYDEAKEIIDIYI